MQEQAREPAPEHLLHGRCFSPHESQALCADDDHSLNVTKANPPAINAFAEVVCVLDISERSNGRPSPLSRAKRDLLQQRGNRFKTSLLLRHRRTIPLLACQPSLIRDWVVNRVVCWIRLTLLTQISMNCSMDFLAMLMLGRTRHSRLCSRIP